MAATVAIRPSASMNNVHLFQLINAPTGLGPLRLAWTTMFAEWAIYLLPLAGLFAWLRGPRAARIELLQLASTVLLALAVAQIVALGWPQPRPFMLHLGNQYLTHAPDPGLPSDHAVVIWALGLAALRTERFALWGLPLLALGLVVGWSRVYLGVHFPLDIAAALPVAGIATLMTVAYRGPLRRALGWLMKRHDRAAQWLRSRSSPVHDARIDKP